MVCVWGGLGTDLCGRNYGYDPLGLAKNPDNLVRFQEGEILNGRWAMLAVPGMFLAEALGYGNWMEAPTWVGYTSIKVVLLRRIV